MFAIDLDKEDEEKGNEDVVWKTPPRFNAGKFLCYLQEDGAPGHGYNNRNKGKPNSTHDALVQNCKIKGLRVVKQSRHTPESNYLDLGIWNILKSAVIARNDEIPDFKKNLDDIEASIWKISKEEWEKIEPRKIFNTTRQRDVILKKIIELKGRSIVKEPHTGIREKFNTGPPKRSLKPEGSQKKAE